MTMFVNETELHVVNPRGIEAFYDPLLSGYPIGGPAWIIYATLAYLLVIAVGREFMRNRKPFALEGTLRAFNLFNIVSNLIIVTAYLTKPGSLLDFLSCKQFDSEQHARLAIIFGGYMVLKVTTISEKCEIHMMRTKNFPFTLARRPVRHYLLRTSQERSADHSSACHTPQRAGKIS